MYKNGHTNPPRSQSPSRLNKSAPGSPNQRKRPYGRNRSTTPNDGLHYSSACDDAAIHGDPLYYSPRDGHHASHSAKGEKSPRPLGNTASLDPSQIKGGSNSSRSVYYQWAEEFIRTLFDFSFSEVITVRMLPLLYGLAIAALFVTLGYITIETMIASPFRGVIVLLLIDPLLFIFGTAAIRSLLEVGSALFRVQSLMVEMNEGVKVLEVKMDKLAVNVGGMDGHLGEMVESITDMRDNFKSVTQVVENLDVMADKIPFIKKPKRDDRKNWAESSISERFQYSARSFYKIED